MRLKISSNIVFDNLNNDLQWLKNKTIFLTIHGSKSYGLDTTESDTDLRGVCTVPKEILFGFNKKFDQYIISEPDCTIFNIKKFFNLSANGNPNCLEILFTEPEDHVIISELGELLLDNKEKFISKQVKERYFSYAKAQAYRLSSHRSWLLNPLDHRPTRKEFGLPEKLTIEKNQYDAIKSLINKKIESWNPDFEPFSDSQKIYLQGKVSDILSEMSITRDEKWEAASRSIGLDENLINIIKKEKEFENKINDWNSYLKWKETRNPKRSIMEKKCGYDAKFAHQIVRLLIVGKEILEIGTIKVKRVHDRELLMEIKNGEWSFNKLMDYIESSEKEIKVAYENSKLPNQPDINYLDNLCQLIIQKSLDNDL